MSAIILARSIGVIDTVNRRLRWSHVNRRAQSFAALSTALCE